MDPSPTRTKLPEEKWNNFRFGQEKHPQEKNTPIWFHLFKKLKAWIFLTQLPRFEPLPPPSDTFTLLGSREQGIHSIAHRGVVCWQWLLEKNVQNRLVFADFPSSFSGKSGWDSKRPEMWSWNVFFKFCVVIFANLFESCQSVVFLILVCGFLHSWCFQTWKPRLFLILSCLVLGREKKLMDQKCGDHPKGFGYQTYGKSQVSPKFGGPPNEVHLSKNSRSWGDLLGLW